MKEEKKKEDNFILLVVFIIFLFAAAVFGVISLINLLLGIWSMSSTENVNADMPFASVSTSTHLFESTYYTYGSFDPCEGIKGSSDSVLYQGDYTNGACYAIPVKKVYAKVPEPQKMSCPVGTYESAIYQGCVSDN